MAGCDGLQDRSIGHPALRSDLPWARIRLVLPCPGAVLEHVCLVPALGLSLAAALWGCKDRAWLRGEGSRVRLYPTHVVVLGQTQNRSLRSRASSVLSLKQTLPSGLG